jgi:hypothetical protein
MPAVIRGPGTRPPGLHGPEGSEARGLCLSYSMVILSRHWIWHIVREGRRELPQRAFPIAVTPKAQDRVWSNASTFVHDLRHASNRDTEIKRQLVHADAKRYEIFAEDFPRMNQWQPFKLDHTLRPNGNLRSQRRIHRHHVSLGVAAFPDHGSSPNGLLHAADVALYHTRQSGTTGSRPRRPSSEGEPHVCVCASAGYLDAARGDHC